MNKALTSTIVKQFSFGSNKANIFLLLIISCLVFFLNLQGWDLWNPDEPRYAQIAREMRDTGEWVLPHLNSEVYPDKPPLFFWLIAFFSFFTGGVTEISARFPSALSSVGCILLTYLLGKRLFNARAGLLAGLVLLTNVGFFWLGRRANIDMTLTFFVTLALTFFFLGLQEEDKPRGFYLAPFLFMGLGVLAKGPVGFFLPFLTFLSYLVVTKNLRHLKKLEILWGMGLFAGIILAWLVPACVRGGEVYTNQILFTQNINRFVNAWCHQRPFYYYFYTFPEGFNPWALLLPGAFLWGFSKSQKDLRPNFYFPFCWFAVVFVFFSLSTSKRELYLLPLYPAAAVLIGGFLSHAFSQYRQTVFPAYLLAYPFYFMGGAFIAGGVAFCFLPFFETPISGTIPFFPHILFMALVFIGGGSWIFFNTRKRQLFVSFLTVTFVMLVSFLWSIEAVLPRINLLKSARPMSQRIIHHLPEGKKFLTYGVKVAPFNFYTGINHIKKIPTVEKLIEHLNSHSPGLVLLQEKTFKRLQGQSLIPMGIHPLEKAKIGHRTFLLLSKNQKKEEKRETKG